MVDEFASVGMKRPEATAAAGETVFKIYDPAMREKEEVRENCACVWGRLIPRLFGGREKKGLVTTACACARFIRRNSLIFMHKSSLLLFAEKVFGTISSIACVVELQTIHNLFERPSPPHRDHEPVFHPHIHPWKGCSLVPCCADTGGDSSLLLLPDPSSSLLSS